MAPNSAPDEFVWFEGFRWAEAVSMQAARLEESFGELRSATADAKWRAQLNAPSNAIDQSWREHFDSTEDFGSKPSRVPTWALEMQVASELDLLVVAVRNLLRAQEKLPPARQTEMGDEQVMKLLRDATEHFDEVGGRAETTLTSRYPDVIRNALGFTNKEIWIGGTTGIPLSRIVAWAARVSNALHESLIDEGIAMPSNLLASTIEGDDALPWPAQRLRFGWWVQAADEENWPSETPSAEVLRLLKLRFENQRARDVTD